VNQNRRDSFCSLSPRPPTASGKVEKLTKPGRTKQGSNQMRSKAADLTRMTNIAEGSCRSKDATEQTREGANMTHHITRNLSSGSLPSRAKKQGPPIVPGPPPRKPPRTLRQVQKNLGQNNPNLFVMMYQAVGPISSQMDLQLNKRQKIWLRRKLKYYPESM